MCHYAAVPALMDSYVYGETQSESLFPGSKEDYFGGCVLAIAEYEQTE